tara:strand:+ start:87 stop:305 length:219 start_codon:yes stop_codon:yes gene_type:complete
MQYIIETGTATVDSESKSVTLTGEFKNTPAVTLIGDENVNIFISDVSSTGFNINVSNFTTNITVRYHAIERS